MLSNNKATHYHKIKKEAYYTSIIACIIALKGIYIIVKNHPVFATTFLDKIPVTGNFTFFIANWKKGKFMVSAVVNKSFETTVCNQLTEPVALIKI